MGCSGDYVVAIAPQITLHDFGKGDRTTHNSTSHLAPTWKLVSYLAKHCVPLRLKK
ncbi:hypothetical protein H6G96_27770 [Nostoc sp. FACHB-892]|uniref:hypothetical protein n=1 Tax=Nostoc sp. FACHB-892 TaxID=2692843 RepID=UPI00168A1530|nr:hypothetical protein [Nostoc sp. FACHB-892]MBD2730015.1 hypothetical protein [Nostoc sp. FACHB-892]